MMMARTSNLLSTLLLLAIQSLSLSSAAEFSVRGSTLNQDRGHDERELRKRGCGAKLGTVTVNEINAMGLGYLEPLVTDIETAESSRDVIFSPATYDVQAVKLCSSCDTLVSWYNDMSESFPIDFRSYCNSSDYGYSVEQSMLAFFPLDPATGDVLTGTKLRVFLSLHASRTGSETAPTEAWPLDLTGILNSIQNETVTNQTGLSSPEMSQFIPGLLAASSGSIGLMPDYQGYGESRANRTTFSSTSYVQSSVVAFFGMSKHLGKHYKCTILDNTVTIHGEEDGAFGAIFSAHAFHRFNVRVLKIFSSSGILDLDTMLWNYIRHFDADGTLNERMQSLLDLTAFSFSVGNPDLANTGYAADMVSDAARVDLLQHLGPDSSQLSQTGYNHTNLDVLHPDLVAFYRAALEQEIEHPCNQFDKVQFNGTTHGTNDALVSDETASVLNPTKAHNASEVVQRLCSAIVAASAWPMLLRNEQNADDKVDVDPTLYGINTPPHAEICYSPEDDTVSPKQVAHLKAADLVPGGDSYITFYQGPTGSDGVLQPVGTNHDTILGVCRLSAALFYGLQGHKPEKLKDTPNYMPRLENPLAEECGVVAADPNDEEGEQIVGGDDGSEPDNAGDGTDELEDDFDEDNNSTALFNETFSPLGNETLSPIDSNSSMSPTLSPVAEEDTSGNNSTSGSSGINYTSGSNSFLFFVILAVILSVFIFACCNFVRAHKASAVNDDDFDADVPETMDWEDEYDDKK